MYSLTDRLTDRSSFRTVPEITGSLTEISSFGCIYSCTGTYYRPSNRPFLSSDTKSLTERSSRLGVVPANLSVRLTSSSSSSSEPRLPRSRSLSSASSSNREATAAFLFLLLLPLSFFLPFPFFPFLSFLLFFVGTLPSSPSSLSLSAHRETRARAWGGGGRPNELLLFVVVLTK